MMTPTGDFRGLFRMCANLRVGTFRHEATKSASNPTHHRIVCSAISFAALDQSASVSPHPVLVVQSGMELRSLVDGGSRATASKASRPFSM